MALEIVQSRDRIPYPGFNHDGTVDNFWQDAEHVRGVWRTTTLDSYRSADPAWETIVDFDALSAAEGKNWVYKGATCLPPHGHGARVRPDDADLRGRRFRPAGIQGWGQLDRR